MEQEFAETAFDQNSHRGEGKEISWLRQWTNALDEVAAFSDAERASQDVEMRAERVIEIAQCEAVVAALGANVDRCEQALAVAVAALTEVQKIAPQSNTKEFCAVLPSTSLHAASARLVEQVEVDIVAATRELANARKHWNKDAVAMFKEIRLLRRMNGDWSKFCALPVSH